MNAIPMTTSDMEHRETLARIIDPEAWRAWDLAVERAKEAGDAPKQAVAWADFAFGGAAVEALRKADAILVCGTVGGPFGTPLGEPAGRQPDTDAFIASIGGIDAGIEHATRALHENHVETFESCQGGPGHAFPEPTVRFHGGDAEGLRALSVALTFGLPVTALRRYWSVQAGQPHGPHWEMTFSSPAPDQPSDYAGEFCAARVVQHQVVGNMVLVPAETSGNPAESGPSDLTAQPATAAPATDTKNEHP